MNEHSKRTLPPEITKLLTQLRFRIRLYIWIEGIAAAIAVLGIAFWVGLALDFFLEPPPAIRFVAVAVVACLVGYVLYRLVLNRAFVRLADTNMALLLEKYSIDFHDSLLTAVELAEEPDHATEFNPEMLEHTSVEAQQQLDKANLGRVFNPRPLVRNSLAAVLLIASVVALGVFAGDVLATYLERVAGSPELWPRKTRLQIEGFPDNVAKVAQGGSVDLVILADNAPQYELPKRVEVRYRLDDGTRDKRDARRIGEALPSDAYQTFIHSFKNIVSSHTIDVVSYTDDLFGGDSRIYDLRIEVVESPEIVKMDMLCTYPEYMNTLPRKLPVTGAMDIPFGCELTMVAQASKPLVKVDLVDGEKDPQHLQFKNETEPTQFKYRLGKLTEDRLILLTLNDTDGITSREPVRVSISVIEDQPPQVNVALHGISDAITTMANIPVQGTIEDEYGIASAWFEYQTGAGAAEKRALGGKDPQGLNKFPVDHSLDVNLFEPRLQTGQVLQLGLSAKDRYNLGKEPNIGQSSRFTLKVVTPQELRTSLEYRELMLRKRFETIYNETLDTRNLMAMIEFSTEKPAEKENNEGTPSDKKTSTIEEAEDPAAKALAARKLRIVRCLQNIQRASHETIEVASNFDLIRIELTNNRIDTTELKHRLQNDIADPLREIGGPMMKVLEEQLTQLDKRAASAEQGKPLLRETIAQADKVLVEMKQVLEKMLELEDFNELVEILRQIKEEQVRLIEETERKRKEQLKKLLE